MNLSTVLIRGSLYASLAGALCVLVGQIPTDPPHKWKVRPGTTEWARLDSQMEKIAVCAITKAEAAALSTKDLVRTCMDYPLLGNMLFFSEPSAGVDFMHENFYGFKELVGRADAGKQLVEYYKHPDKHPQFGTAIVSQCLDHLLIDQRLMDVLSASDRSELCRASLRRVYELRKSKKVATQQELAAAYLVCKLMVERGVTLSHRGKLFTASELPSRAAAWLRGEQPGREFPDLMIQFCIDTGNN